MSIYDVTIIGLGRLGSALALAFSQNGYKVSQLVVRNNKNVEEITGRIKPKPDILTIERAAEINADIIFITTQDSEIVDVAEKLARNLEQLPLVFHASGALDSNILEPLRQLGCEVASFHPLVSISDPIGGAASFQDKYFCLEGDENAVFIGRQIVETLGGKPFAIKPGTKPLYHASAVIACGHLTALLSIALEVFSKCGLDDEKAKEILLPLVSSTINNISKQTPAEALTGTFARGDAASLNEHLRAFRGNMSDELLEIYLLLGERSLDLAKQQGTSEDVISGIRQIISENRKVLV